MVGVTICLIALFLMSLTSTLYHCMPFGSNHKYVFRKLDHICIFLAIAGTYTPVALTLIGGWQGFLVLVIEWTAVLFGILLKSISSKSYPKLSMMIYMAMGWAAIMFLPLLLQKASLTFLIYIVVLKTTCYNLDILEVLFMANKSMRDMIKLKLGEEIANCVTHGIMAILILCILAPASL